MYCVCRERAFPGLLMCYSENMLYWTLSPRERHRGKHREKLRENEGHSQRTERMRNPENKNNQWKTLQGTNERWDKRTWRKERSCESKEGSDSDTLCVCKGLCFLFNMGSELRSVLSRRPVFTSSHTCSHWEMPSSASVLLTLRATEQTSGLRGDSESAGSSWSSCSSWMHHLSLSHAWRLLFSH